LRRVKWAAKKHSELFYSALCARIYKKNSTLFFYPAAAGDHHLNTRECSSCAYETNPKRAEELAEAQITTQKFITVSDHSN